jgi:hypothetical protein
MGFDSSSFGAPCLPAAAALPRSRRAGFYGRYLQVEFRPDETKVPMFAG